MNKINFKQIQFFLVCITVLVITASFYFQYVLGLHPCPLCFMQRLCVFVLLVLLGLSLTTIKKAHIICSVQIIIACLGLYFSLRQLWLQSLPLGTAPACMPGMDTLIRYFPWQTVMRAFLWGSTDCAEVNWRMLGITMPGWSALYFLFVILISMYLFIRTRKRY